MRHISSSFVIGLLTFATLTASTISRAQVDADAVHASDALKEAPVEAEPTVAKPAPESNLATTMTAASGSVAVGFAGTVAASGAIMTAALVGAGALAPLMYKDPKTTKTIFQVGLAVTAASLLATLALPFISPLMVGFVSNSTGAVLVGELVGSVGGAVLGGIAAGAGVLVLSYGLLLGVGNADYTTGSLISIAAVPTAVLIGVGGAAGGAALGTLAGNMIGGALTSTTESPSALLE